MVKGELFSARCVKHRAAEAQDSVLTADNLPEVFLAVAGWLSWAGLQHLTPSLKQNHSRHVLLSSAQCQ